MTFAPPTLLALMHEWVANGGANLGIVGDAAHAATGTSYHLGRSQLKPGAYSAILARDVAGLSEAAAACDFGQLHGSLHNLQRFSQWFVDQVVNHPTTYRDVREVIFSPDGVKVLRWDNHARRLYTGGDGTGQGDNTHLWHTHVSWYRDSEFRAKAQLIAPYFTGTAPAPSPTPEVDMPGVNADFLVTHDPVPWDALGNAVIVGTGHDILNYSTAKPAYMNVPAGKVLGIVQRAIIRAPQPPWAAVGEEIVVYNISGVACVSPRRDVKFTPLTAPPDVTPYGPADLTVAEQRGFDGAKAKAVAAVQSI